MHSNKLCFSCAAREDEAAFPLNGGALTLCCDCAAELMHTSALQAAPATNGHRVSRRAVRAAARARAKSPQLDLLDPPKRPVP